MPFTIENKNVLITGATSGIGKAAAIKLAQMGANIYFIARNSEKAKNLVNELQSLSGAKASFFIANLSSLEEIKKVSEEFKSLSIPLHVLLNNAGLINNQRKETIDGFEEVFAINHLAYFFLTNLLIDCLNSL